MKHRIYSALFFPLPMIDPADLTRLSSARVVTVGRDYFSARAKLPLKTVV
jgi:hypothetical protein